MAIYPGAVYKPTPFGGRVPRTRQGRGILHVAVSAAESLPPSSADTWHFYVARAAPDGSTDGSGGPAYCEQYVDTDHRAYGDVDANDDALVVETAGGLGSSAQLNAEEWTRAQELRLADIMRWEASQPDGAPLELLPDARAGRRGWGTHRLGIKHSGGPRPGWWQPGCELWSNKLGKECPGDAKVAQVPDVIKLARTGPQEDDMFKNDPDLRFAIGDIAGNVRSTNEAMAREEIRSERILAALKSEPVDIDALGDRIAKQLVPPVITALAGKGGLTAEDARQAIRDVLGSLDGS